MAGLVGAAGSIAGGLAGGALKNALQGDDESVIPQVDPAASLAYYRQATESNKFYTEVGLGIYNNEMGRARDEIIRGYAEGIGEIRYLSESGKEATNELMRFIGLDPIPATRGMRDELKGVGIDDTTEIQALMQEAQVERDPERRLELEAQVQEAITSAPVIDRTEEMLEAIGPMPTYAYMGDIKPLTQKLNKKTMEFENVVNEPLRQTLINEAHASYQSQLQTWKRQRARVIAQEKIAVQDRERLRNQFAQEFVNTYEDEFDAAYTGEEVAEQVTATPGYEFQMREGTRALERQGAAAGMLGSTNTQLALQRYGQELGLGFYQTHLSNLANIASIGSAATAQVSGYEVSKGQDLANIASAKGSTALNAYSNIGQTSAANFNAAAGMLFDTESINANLRYNFQQAELNRQADTAQQALAAGPANRQVGLQAASQQGVGLAAQQAFGGGAWGPAQQRAAGWLV